MMVVFSFFLNIQDQGKFLVKNYCLKGQHDRFSDAVGAIDHQAAT